MQKNGYDCLKLSFCLLLLITSATKGFAQNDDNNDEETHSHKPTKLKGLQRFQVGLYIGTYFANDYTAGIYDGYGYDIYNVKNSFDNSLMNQRIMAYGGANGSTDYIALALGVNHNDWSFDQSNMPINMSYSVAFSVGLHTRYCINKRDALIFNLNATKLTVTGNFTITITAPTVNSTTGFSPQRTFGIQGGEQRLMSQVGYQRLLGDIGKINFFVEGGLAGTLSKYDKNLIMINSLTIDLAGYYSQPGYVVYRPTQLTTRFGLGAFGGLGLNFSLHPNLTVQFLYSPSYETIMLGDNPKPTLQHAIGLRAYGNF